jgi:hypothetical protein
MPPDRILPTRGDALAGLCTLAEIDALIDGEAKLLRGISLLEVLVRDMILESEAEASKSLHRMLESLSYAGRHPRSVSFRALEFSLNVRNALLHPNSSLRQTAPVQEHEIDFASFIIASAIRELADRLAPETARRIRGEDHAEPSPALTASPGSQPRGPSISTGETLGCDPHDPLRDPRLRVSSEPPRF